MRVWLHSTQFTQAAHLAHTPSQCVNTSQAEHSSSHASTLTSEKLFQWQRDKKLIDSTVTSIVASMSVLMLIEDTALSGFMEVRTNVSLTHPF